MSRYDLFRRRIAPIAFFLAVALLARDACEGGHRTHTTVDLQLGAAMADVRDVDVEVLVGGEQVARFHRAALPGATIGPCRFPLSLPQDDGELRIAVEVGTEHRLITRRFHAIEGSTMTIALGDELRETRETR